MYVGESSRCSFGEQSSSGLQFLSKVASVVAIVGMLQLLVLECQVSDNLLLFVFYMCHEHFKRGVGDYQSNSKEFRESFSLASKPLEWGKWLPKKDLP